MWSGGITMAKEYVINESINGDDLRRLRQLLGMTQKEFAVFTNASKRTVENWESKDFTEGWNLITLERLFKDTYGVGLNKIIYSTADHVERLKILVEQVERTTGLKGFGIYMSKLLTVDALFLNKDRHTHNIAVLTNGTGDFRLAPIFDNGAGLLSDTSMEYPLTRDPLEWIPKVKAKTFCDSFEEQLEIAEKLYGENLHFSFDYNEVKTIVEEGGTYPEEIRRRVIDVVMEMKRRYSYLFICE